MGQIVKQTQQHWQTSGTKILGWIIMAIGFLGGLDSVTTGWIVKAVGPKYGPTVYAVIMACAGLAVKLRGHKNTADIAAQIVSQASTGEVQESAQVVTAVAQTAVAADNKVPSTPPQEKSG